MLDTQMIGAWREAAACLAIRVLAPHSFTLPDGRTVDVEAFLPDFGDPSGAIAVALADHERGRLAELAGCFVSRLAATYCVFDRELFRETLDDWGWHGPSDARPTWYTGKPWA